MIQNWIRTYPLHWFDSFLSRIALPFSKAETLEVYARNGYFLLGIVLAMITCGLWAVGLITGSLRQLPVGMRDTIKYLLEFIGIRNPPETLRFE